MTEDVNFVDKISNRIPDRKTAKCQQKILFT